MDEFLHALDQPTQTFVLYFMAGLSGLLNFWLEPEAQKGRIPQSPSG